MQNHSHCIRQDFCLLKKVLIFKKINLFIFIYFWLRWVFAAAHWPSLVARAGATFHCGARASHCCGFSLLQSTGSRRAGFSSCGSWAQ